MRKNVKSLMYSLAFVCAGMLAITSCGSSNSKNAEDDSDATEQTEEQTEEQADELSPEEVAAQKQAELKASIKPGMPLSSLAELDDVEFVQVNTKGVAAPASTELYVVVDGKCYATKGANGYKSGGTLPKSAVLGDEQSTSPDRLQAAADAAYNQELAEAKQMVAAFANQYAWAWFGTDGVGYPKVSEVNAAKGTFRASAGGGSVNIKVGRGKKGLYVATPAPSSYDAP